MTIAFVAGWKGLLALLQKIHMTYITLCHMVEESYTNCNIGFEYRSIYGKTTQSRTFVTLLHDVVWSLQWAWLIELFETFTP